MSVTQESQPLQIGDRVEVEVGPVAHGGHCVARHAGRVLFVRHAIPGEQVVAQITDIGPKGRFLRADAVRVDQPSEQRIQPACPWSGPGRCGGCDFQHVDLDHQRVLKAQVVAEQFSRLAGIDLEQHLGGPVGCEAVPGDNAGLDWRTRVEFAVDVDGTVGLRQHRSHAIVPVETCRIAHPAVQANSTWSSSQSARSQRAGLAAIDVIATQAGLGVTQPPEVVTVTVPETERPPNIRENVVTAEGNWAFQLNSRGFWQVHPGSAATFSAVVGQWLNVQPGESGLDLYAGVGLFARGLAQAVGREGKVLAVESDRAACGHGAQNLSSLPQASMRRDRTDRVVRQMRRDGEHVDVIVLDPPRVGAGKAVVADITGLSPRAIAYVACDPAALARDTAYLRDSGYVLRKLRVLDAFPMTHHMECIALFEPVRHTEDVIGR